MTSQKITSSKSHDLAAASTILCTNSNEDTKNKKSIQSAKCVQMKIKFNKKQNSFQF
jgi:hypothetical protein